MLFEFANIPASLDAMLPENEGQLKREISRAVGIGDLGDFKLLKRSVDARNKGNVHFAISVAAEVPGATLQSLRRHARKGVRVALQKGQERPLISDVGDASSRDGFLRPIVVGAGPAGLMCALHLAKAKMRPIVIERGRDVARRQADVRRFLETGELDPDSNVQFGEGGAGTFSDGKLTTGTKSPLVRYVLEQFAECGAPADILVDARPHIGTDCLPEVVSRIRRLIEDAGGDVLFDAKLVGITTEECNGRRRRVCAASVESLATGKIEHVRADFVVLAIGHSARDTYKMLGDMGLTLERKPFAVGVRIEHPQRLIDKAQYGKAAGHRALGAADYKLAAHIKGGRGVYTFCMCPGGTVVAASSEEGSVCVNGMSPHARDGENANSALLAEVRPQDLPGSSPFAGIELQRRMEVEAFRIANAGQATRYAAPVQTVGDFLSGSCGSESKLVRPTYPRGVRYADLNGCLPGFVSSSLKEALPALDRKLHGFAHPEAVLTGVEARSSSPVRILRDRETLESVDVLGLYPAGEGAGYAGGIMSSAVDGIRIAQSIAQRASGA